MTFDMYSLPSEFYMYVASHIQEYKRLSNLIARNERAILRLDIKLENLLTSVYVNQTNTDLVTKLNSIINECNELLEKAENANNDEHREKLDIMEKNYHIFMESYGIDMDDRTYDEDFYAFIHGIE